MLSTFKNMNNLLCKKANPAITVAFLTLMTLKLENKEICVKLTPNDIWILQCLVFDLAFPTFVGLL